MESFYLKDLVKAVNGKFLIGDLKAPITSISIDSRTVKKGEVFFALKGANFNGHDFIVSAIEKGASIIVYSDENAVFPNNSIHFPALIKVEDTLEALGALAKAYRAKFNNIKVFAITGSNGKTTTKEMLASILNVRGKTLSNKGNFNNRIGLPLSVFNLSSEYKNAVFELGTSIKGEIAALADIVRPDAAVITNIGYSHLETFINPDGVFEEKKVLFDFVNDNGFIVLNIDDERLKTLEGKIQKKVITVSTQSSAEVYADSISVHEDIQRFYLHHGQDRIFVNIPAKGRFNISNALSAAACAIGAGCNLEEIQKGLENVKLPAMRMDSVVLDSGETLVNDAYNANPSSVRNSISAICESYPKKEVTLVLGDMLELGDKSADYHREIGEFLNTKKLNAVYLIGDMSSEIQKTSVKNKTYHFKDPDELATALNKHARGEKSVFLFKGSRGMKLETIYQKFREALEKRKE